MTLTVDSIRCCLEGVIPGMMATCAPDGTPNVAYISQVQYVDTEHVALSFQFFNKTRQNVLANPRATLMLVDPDTSAFYRLAVRYLRTETAGPLFESMKAKLAGIASHTGMAGVFMLRGSDVYRVEAIEAVPGTRRPAPPPRRSAMPALRRTAERLARCRDLDGFLDETLAALAAEFGIGHAMVLLLDQQGQRLYTVASRGYPASGVGSEIPLGQGVIGVAAREATPIRISHLTGDYAYARTVRAGAEAGGLGALLETEIPLPGLAEAHSQLAVPVVAFGNTLGVLFVESPQELRFTYDDEDALVGVAAQLGMAIQNLQAVPECVEEEVPAAATGGAAGEPTAAAAGATSAAGTGVTPEGGAGVVAAPQAAMGAAPAGMPGGAARTASAQASGPPCVARHFAADGSVFLDDDYLIKGVAGAIFWTLASDYVNQGRTAFTNRELRLDPRVRLPDISDNLEARLILLERRLVERNACVRIEKTGRGRFRLAVTRPLQLVGVPA